MSTTDQRPQTVSETLTLLSRPSRSQAHVRSNLHLARELAVASFKLKYAGSALGYVWSLMRPLMVFGMLYVVFALFLLRGRTAPGENFPVELLVAIVAWTFVAEATTSAASSVVANSDMLRKSQFPRWILVVASVISAAMTLIVNLALVLTLGLILHWFVIGWQTLWVPVLLLELCGLALGLGLVLSAFFVYYRDVAYVWEIVLLLLFYGSAVIFPFTLVPAGARWFVTLNPIAQIIEDLRRALVSEAAPWSVSILGPGLAIPLLGVVLCCLLGAAVFTRLSARFGEAL